MNDPRRFLDNYLEKKEGKRLRGQRISSIKADLQNDKLSQKEKVLKYSDHLNWALKSLERIYKTQQVASKKYMNSAYDHGIANGLILAMAILVEEQAQPPFLKVEGKYKKSDSQWVSDAIEQHVMHIEALLGNMILADDDGPKGYDSFADWAGDVIATLTGAPMETPKIKAVRNQIFEQAKKQLELENETNNENDGPTTK
jgi:hypothetical protein